MKLTSGRSVLRGVILSSLIVPFGYVTIFGDSAALWVRAVCAVLAGFFIYELVEYVCCIRRWRWTSETVAATPTLRKPHAIIQVSDPSSLILVDYGFTLVLTLRQPGGRDTKLPLNVFVSRSDVRRWIGR